MEKGELIEYMKVLKCRERAHYAEEQVDAVRMKRLCGEPRLSMKKGTSKGSTNKR